MPCYNLAVDISKLQTEPLEIMIQIIQTQNTKNLTKSIKQFVQETF